jgi:hypothetical protein
MTGTAASTVAASTVTTVMTIPPIAERTNVVAKLTPKPAKTVRHVGMCALALA